MPALFSLIRLPNLLIVVFTQWLLYEQVLVPALSAGSISRQLDDTQFVIFVIVTVLITASGYIINDILDYKTDLLNKPGKVIIKRFIDFGTAYWLYFVFNLLGFVLALYLAFIVEYLPYLFLFPFAVTGLYLYSHFLKRMALLGNFLIAFYCAGVAAILLIAEWASVMRLFHQSPEGFYRMLNVFIWYGVFAFLATLFRELIKDLQDEEGDRENNLRTAPIIWGQLKVKRLAIFIGLLLLAFVIFWAYSFYSQIKIAGWLILGVGVIAPLIYTLILLERAYDANQFYDLSKLAKWLMLAGILILWFIEI